MNSWRTTPLHNSYILLFLSNAFASCHQLDTVYLDITKAFNTVSIINLLQKLSGFNISGNPLTWFEQYLTYRFQFVSINNTYSCLLPVASGVPQGSILGPLLLFYAWMIFLIPSTGVKHSSLHMILNASNILSHQMINN